MQKLTTSYLSLKYAVVQFR